MLYNTDIEKYNQNSELNETIEALNQEISSLKSKLTDEERKNFQINDMLELRTQYIAQLQEYDQVNKARIILQLREIEELRGKQMKAKKLKAELNEKINTLKDNEKMLEFENNQLMLDIKARDDKIATYKGKLKENRTF